MKELSWDVSDLDRVLDRKLSILRHGRRRRENVHTADETPDQSAHPDKTGVLDENRAHEPPSFLRSLAVLLPSCEEQFNGSRRPDPVGLELLKVPVQVLPLS